MNALLHITELYSESVFQKFNKDRFGLESCKPAVDSEYAFELKTIYERLSEKESCGISSDSSCCCKQTIEETINTL
jgi:hypothetical protein